MDNRVDFYRGERKSLAIPAGRAAVYIDGVLRPGLEVIEIVRGGWKEFGRATLRCSGAQRGRGQVECGMHAAITQVYNGLHPDAGAFDMPLFAGQVEEIHTRLGPDFDSTEITVRDFSSVLERITVYGRWARDIDGSVKFLSGAGTIFNEQGTNNACGEGVERDGEVVRVFAGGQADNRAWKCADAIHYLLCMYLAAGQIATPEIERLRAIAGDAEIRDADVTGMSLLEAVYRCCEEAGVEFRFAPREDADGPSEAIVFYRPGAGRRVELNLQEQGERLSVSRTNVWKCEVRRASAQTQRYIGQGDFKVFEGTFNLVKAWDAALESTQYEAFSPSTNPDFAEVRDVYRKWCLNEAGDYSGGCFDQGPAYDFSKVFGTRDFVHRRRRFWPALSRDAQGRSLGYVLEISYNSGADWRPYPFAFNNLLDECGVRLSSDKLDEYVWVAALKGALRLRITASVASDERLCCVVADGPVGSTTPAVDRVVQLAGRFKYRKVSAASAIASSNADEVDDTDALYGHVRRLAETQKTVIASGMIVTPYLRYDFQPGDAVTCGPDGRDIFGIRGDNRSICTIERVRMDFEKQCTEVDMTIKREK